MLTPHETQALMLETHPHRNVLLQVIVAAVVVIIVSYFLYYRWSYIPNWRVLSIGSFRQQRKSHHQLLLLMLL